DAAQLRVQDVDGDGRPRVDAERPRAFVGADREQRVDGEHVAPAGLAPRDAVQLAQLLERVDAHVRVRADAQADPAAEKPLHRQEAVAEIRLGRRARTHTRAGLAEQVELA